MKQLSIFDTLNDFTENKKYHKGLLKSKGELVKLAEADGRTKIYRVLSFEGTKSARLFEEHLRGNIDYDYIVFADTGAEPQFVHDQVAWWKERQKKFGNTTPFITATHNSMQRGLEEMLMRYIFTDYQRFQMPLYFSKTTEEGEVKPAGMMPRQCTSDFKIVPVQQAVRNLIKKELGIKHTQPMPKCVGIIMDLGYSFDEIRRVSGFVSHQSKYIYLSYPLIEEGFTADENTRYLEKNGFPSNASRCYLCPFNCDDKGTGMKWEEIIRVEPLSFLKACYFDEQLRTVQAKGLKNMRSIPYFHYSRKPLVEVYHVQFNELLEKYETEMEEWTSEWSDFLLNKYGNHRMEEEGSVVEYDIVEQINFSEKLA